MNIQSAMINTAGAYVYINGFFLFVIGVRLYNGRIPIVRLGGHREEHETGWQCALREVHEEANLHIKPLATPITYLSDWDDIEANLQEVQWKQQGEHEPDPILVITYRREQELSLSLMYLAYADALPTPSSEVKGLLLLREEEIHTLCQAPHTLDEYLRRGGMAMLNAEFDHELILEPFAQFRLLSRILNMRSRSKLADLQSL